MAHDHASKVLSIWAKLEKLEQEYAQSGDWKRAQWARAKMGEMAEKLFPGK